MLKSFINLFVSVYLFIFIFVFLLLIFLLLIIFHESEDFNNNFSEEVRACFVVLLLISLKITYYCSKI